MNMHTPPENQGQIVTVSYGSTHCFAYRRTQDAGDQTTYWSRCSWSDIWDALPEGREPDWDPVNSVPSLPKKCKWKSCTEEDVDRDLASE
jgi:hypothetical protein